MAIPKREPKKLDIQAEFESLQNMYKEDKSAHKLNILLLGESGGGKTFLMSTAPKLVHIDSFDPGGSKGLKEWIDKGEIMCDARWEQEDPMDAKQFLLWEKEMDRRINGGYFDHISTYMLDSSTMWAQAIMNEILKKAGIPGQNPRFTHDYGPQKSCISRWMKKLLLLPCHVVITGHLEMKSNGEGGKLVQRFMTTGKGVVMLPLMFDEIWVMEPKDTSKGVEYGILTQSTGTNIARSRLSQGGKLDQYEKPNLTDILKKGGYE